MYNKQQHHHQPFTSSASPGHHLRPCHSLISVLNGIVSLKVRLNICLLKYIYLQYFIFLSFLSFLPSSLPRTAAYTASVIASKHKLTHTQTLTGQHALWRKTFFKLCHSVVISFIVPKGVNEYEYVSHKRRENILREYLTVLPFLFWTPPRAATLNPRSAQHRSVCS